MRSRLVVLAGSLLMYAAALFGQSGTGQVVGSGGDAKLTTPQAPSPTLKPEVALKIRDLQLQQSKAEGEFANIQARIKLLQEEYTKRQGELVTRIGTALHDSGLDETKYEVNPETLVVTAKPVVPAVAKEPKKP